MRPINLLHTFLATAAMFTCVAGSADATTITFTDRAAFEAAAGSIVTTDFNAEPTGTFTSRDLGLFTASESDAAVLIGIAAAGPNPLADGNDTSTDGTNHLFFHTEFSQAPITLAFDSPISAFGFDYRATDHSDDGFDLLVLGTQYSVSAGAPSTGFFGIIDTTGTFSSIAFKDDIDGGGVQEGVGIDNVTQNGVAAVPEPSTLFLFGSGLIAAVRRFRRK